MMRDKITPKF